MRNLEVDWRLPTREVCADLAIRTSKKMAAWTPLAWIASTGLDCQIQAPCWQSARKHLPKLTS